MVAAAEQEALKANAKDMVASGKPVQATVNTAAASSELVVNQGGLPIIKD